MKRVLSGTRPTGKAHLGNLAGAFLNWVKLQAEHQCFFFVADWHVLTTHWREPRLRENTLEMVKDWLAVGLDPERSTLFMQSAIPEHAELALLFGMLVSLQRALRVPSFKEHLEDVRAEVIKGRLTGEVDVAAELKTLKDEVVRELLEYLKTSPDPKVLPQKVAGAVGSLADRVHEAVSKAFSKVRVEDTPGFEAVSYGFLGYPILQAADIAIYRAHYVPVGEDQVPHIELTREIVRRFNSTYKPVFPEPEPILTPTPRILGIDGRKMSKRYDNGIYIADPPEEVKKKVMAYYTDPQRVRKTDPGHPERCPLFTLIKAFLPEEAEERAEACRKGQIGCVECKRRTAEGLLKFLEPLRERREKFSDDDVVEILREGTKKAREEAQKTMEEVRRAVGTAWIYHE